MTVSELLLAAQNKLCLTQDEIAKLLKSRQSAISLYIKKKRNPGKKTLRRFVDILNKKCGTHYKYEEIDN